MGYTKKRKSTTRRKMRGGQPWIKVDGKWVRQNPTKPESPLKNSMSLFKVDPISSKIKKFGSIKGFKKPKKTNTKKNYKLYKGKWLTASQIKKAEEAKTTAPSKTVKATSYKPMTAATAKKMTQRAKTLQRVGEEDLPSTTAFSEEEV
jgi:hypothetical protein